MKEVNSSEVDAKMASDEESALKEPLFKDLDAEDPETAPTEVESMCMSCGENGNTKLLLTKIPHYKEVILMSFNCEHCGYQNNEIQSGGKVQDLGVKYKVKLHTNEDLSRQLVKSDYATLIVPEIDLEIPPSSQKGTITTVEGVLKRTIAGLMQDQPVRQHMDPEGAAQIEHYVAKIEALLRLQQPFHVIIVDPSGNSFVENPHAPRSDPHREVSHFLRSREQDHALGFYTEVNNTVNTEVASQQPEEQEKELASSTASTTSSTLLLRCQEGEVGDEASLEEGKAEYSGKGCKEATGIDCEVALPRVLSASTTSTALGTQTTSEKKQQPQQLDLTDEVLNFPTNCPECSSPADTKMKVTNIPHFKEVVIMATVCEYCGHKTNEVKSGGGIEPKGKRILLNVTDPSDMSRDVLKSETCSLSIPDLEFEMGGYALGGRFTTLEGLLNNVLEQVDTNPLWGATTAVGDSAQKEQKDKVEKFKSDLQALKDCKKLPFSIILDDPAGNSYIQNTYAPDPDPEMKIEEYERSYEQDDDLGLNDMNTENYLPSDQKSMESS